MGRGRLEQTTTPALEGEAAKVTGELIRGEVFDTIIQSPGGYLPPAPVIRNCGELRPPIRTQVFKEGAEPMLAPPTKFSEEVGRR